MELFAFLLQDYYYHKKLNKTGKRGGHLYEKIRYVKRKYTSSTANIENSDSESKKMRSA